MVWPWALHLAVVSTLLGMAAVAGEELARLYGKPRRWFWAVALVGSPVLAFGPLLLSRLGLWRASVALVEGEPSAGAGGWPVEYVAKVLAPALEAGGDASWLEQGGSVVMTALVWLDASATVVWPAATAAAVAGLLWSMVRLGRRRRLWSLRRLKSARVAVSAESGPAVVGLARPVVVVPGWIVRDGGLRRPVMRHEAEHVRAGDAWLLAGACAAVALMPWNPATWWQARRLRAAVELDCDLRVLRRGERASRYGRMLLHVADRTGGPAGAWATLAQPRTVLERRIRAMTERKQQNRGARAAALLVVGGSLVAAACDANAPLLATGAAAATVQQAMRSQAGTVHVRIRSDGRFEMNGVEATAESVLSTLSRLGGDVPVAVTVDPRANGASALDRLLSVFARPSEADEAIGIADDARERRIEVKPEPELREIPNVEIGEVRRRGVELQLRKIPEPKSGFDELMKIESRPLFVVDGIILGRDVRESAIDALDIESVEVIKGAAAAKLYGERAAHGIISITTKRRGGR